ncbi:MAG: molybdopterin molybdotransferase MoeA [Rickettsiales bacterium]|nr:molybdopterin molybdotransferase MoeA [Rickettsiales bacterium]
MISYQEALEIIYKNSHLNQTETIPLLRAIGKSSASEVFSKIQVPSFDNSAMDGFAVKASELKSASTDNNKKLKIIAIIGAGEIAEESHSGAIQIMTGAPVPKGYDAVIPIEDVELDGDFVTFKRPARKNENIRFAGEDVVVGQIVLHKDKKITSEDIMLLAAVGITKVEVYKTPFLKIFSTGNEITDDYNQPLPDGKIYNSNAPYLVSKALEEGLNVEYGGVIADDKVKFEKAVSSVAKGAIIISTGAVSKGKWDFIPESLKNLGAEIHFHRVNIRPGKPVLFATLPNGNYFFGLPGNPISTAIGFRFFITPLLRKVQGLDVEKPLFARLKNKFTKKGNFRQFLKSTLEFSSDGILQISINEGQESFKISPMAQSNAWAILEENKTEFLPGDLLQVVSISFKINYD